MNRPVPQCFEECRYTVGEMNHKLTKGEGGGLDLECVASCYKTLWLADAKSGCKPGQHCLLSAIPNVTDLRLQLKFLSIYASLDISLGCWAVIPLYSVLVFPTVTMPFSLSFFFCGGTDLIMATGQCCSLLGVRMASEKTTNMLKV